MEFSVKITVALKEGLLDPEGKALQDALKNLGFTTHSLRTARLFRVGIEAPDSAAAEAMARRMCERLLANPVIHRYEIEVAG